MKKFALSHCVYASAFQMSRFSMIYYYLSGPVAMADNNRQWSAVQCNNTKYIFAWSIDFHVWIIRAFHTAINWYKTPSQFTIHHHFEYMYTNGYPSHQLNWIYWEFIVLYWFLRKQLMCERLNIEHSNNHSVINV